MSALDEYLTQAKIASAPEPVSEVVDTTPQITEEVRKDNLRRLGYPVFITRHKDGTSTFVHNPSIGRDVLISAGGTDRGTGTTESIAMLADEGSVSVAGIGKELWDASGNGNASFKDLTWDVLGTAVGIAICWAIEGHAVTSQGSEGRSVLLRNKVRPHAVPHHHHDMLRLSAILRERILLFARGEEDGRGTGKEGGESHGKVEW